VAVRPFIGTNIFDPSLLENARKLEIFVFPRYSMCVMPLASPNVRVNRTGVVRCEAEWSWHPVAERLDDFDFLFVWAGRGEMLCDDKPVSMRPGSAFCLRPRHQYHATHDPQHRLGVCFIHFDFVDASGAVIYPKDADLPPHFGRLAKVQFYEGVLRHVAELFQSGNAGAKARAADYLALALSDFRHESSFGGPSGLELEYIKRITKVMRHVRESPGRIFAVSELSKLAAYSKSHFTRIFTRVAGIGPKEFCIRVRMERAQQFLLESSMSIDQIALALGYADMFFFSRQFKQQFGMPPRRWRMLESRMKRRLLELPLM
jgi:AraC-like DNA-binding protein